MSNKKIIDELSGANIAAFVMARGGSKGVPKKNIRPLNGIPMIMYTFNAAKNSKLIKRCFLSTDSREIADIGKRAGVEVPFIRPEKLASDTASGFDALIHAVKWVIKNLHYKPDIVVELLPTSPLRKAEDIDEALMIMIEKKADSIVSLTPASQHPCWMKVVDKKGVIKPLLNTPFTTRRRQDLPVVYALHGAIKAARCDFLLKNNSWYGKKTAAYIMPPERSLEVDSILDFEFIEYLISKGNCAL
jgi:CMP-N-acetylneuraminic acid synthetase